MMKLALLFSLLVGCADEGNRVIDTTDRRPPPEGAEMEGCNATMERAAKEGPSP